MYGVWDAAKGRLTKMIHIGLSGDRWARAIVTDSWALIFYYVHGLFWLGFPKQVLVS